MKAMDSNVMHYVDDWLLLPPSFRGNGGSHESKDYIRSSVSDNSTVDNSPASSFKNVNVMGCPHITMNVTGFNPSGHLTLSQQCKEVKCGKATTWYSKGYTNDLPQTSDEIGPNLQNPQRFSQSSLHHEVPCHETACREAPRLGVTSSRKQCHLAKEECVDVASSMLKSSFDSGYDHKGSNVNKKCTAGLDLKSEGGITVPSTVGEVSVNDEREAHGSRCVETTKCAIDPPCNEAYVYVPLGKKKQNSTHHASLYMGNVGKQKENNENRVSSTVGPLSKNLLNGSDIKKNDKIVRNLPFYEKRQTPLHHTTGGPFWDNTLTSHQNPLPLIDKQHEVVSRGYYDYASLQLTSSFTPRATRPRKTIGDILPLDDSSEGAVKARKLCWQYHRGRREPDACGMPSDQLENLVKKIPLQCCVNDACHVHMKTQWTERSSFTTANPPDTASSENECDNECDNVCDNECDNVCDNECDNECDNGGNSGCDNQYDHCDCCIHESCSKTSDPRFQTLNNKLLNKPTNKSTMRSVHKLSCGTLYDTCYVNQHDVPHKSSKQRSYSGRQRPSPQGSPHLSYLDNIPLQDCFRDAKATLPSALPVSDVQDVSKTVHPTIREFPESSTPRPLNGVGGNESVSVTLCKAQDTHPQHTVHPQRTDSSNPPYPAPLKSLPLFYGRLYNVKEGMISFSESPLDSSWQRSGELRRWPILHEAVIGQNSSKRKVHRGLWYSRSVTNTVFPVAVKFVEDGNARDGRSIKREIECYLYIHQRLGQLKNEENLAHIEDAWPSTELFGYYLDKQHPGRCVIITRKLSGPDLFHVIRQESARCCQLFCVSPQMATMNALNYQIHKLRWCALALKRVQQYAKLGIRHNDLKPDNIVLDIFVTPEGRQVLDVKIIDLGTASMYFTKEFTGGTTWYESPEQKILEYLSKKHKISTASERVVIGLTSDVWAAGLSVTEILLGRRVVDAARHGGPFPLHYRGQEAGWEIEPAVWVQRVRETLFASSPCPIPVTIDDQNQFNSPTPFHHFPKIDKETLVKSFQGQVASIFFPFCFQAAQLIFDSLVRPAPFERGTLQQAIEKLHASADLASSQLCHLRASHNIDSHTSFDSIISFPPLS